MICHYNQSKVYTSSGDLDNIFCTDGAVKHYLCSQNCNGWLFLLVAKRRFFPVAYKDGCMEKVLQWNKAMLFIG